MEGQQGLFPVTLMCFFIRNQRDLSPRQPQGGVATNRSAQIGGEIFGPGEAKDDLEQVRLMTRCLGWWSCQVEKLFRCWTYLPPQLKEMTWW